MLRVRGCPPALQDLRQHITLLDNDLKVMHSVTGTIKHTMRKQQEKIKDNKEKIKLNKTLPYLVATVVEVSLSPRARRPARAEPPAPSHTPPTFTHGPACPPALSPRLVSSPPSPLDPSRPLAR